MKTIDLLVQALPAIGGWPEKVTHIGQDYDRELIFYGRGNVRSGIFLDQLAADHRKHGEKGTKITREQCEAALAAKNEGWIEWSGGECPVPRGTLVDVKYLCGDVNRHIKAGEPDSSGSIDTAFAVRWSKLGAEYDIIAYRLHQPQEAEQAKADEEADLNECIGQDAAPVWNGKGLPPVGCECEWQDKNTKQWNPVKVVYASEWVTVIREINKEKGDDLVEIAIENYGDDARLKFRPIRSEADRKREKAIAKITDAICGEIPDTGMATAAKYAARAYDAIAAGKIKGMKLED